MIDEPIPAAEQKGSPEGFAPNPLWASVELVLAVAVIVAGLTIRNVVFVLGSTPWLVTIGAAALWWRGPGFREIGFAQPASWLKTAILGLSVGVGYQLVGTFAVEPVIARLTFGDLPDVSQFRSIVGNEMQLAFWIAMSWTIAAFLEELAYRGWILTRIAEIGRFSRGSWLSAAVASSALFGLVHAYQGLSGMIATGLTALVFAGVYLATGRNLWGAIFAHGVLDTAAFVMMYFNAYPGL